MAERGIKERHLRKAAKSCEVVSGSGDSGIVRLRGRRKNGRRLDLVRAYEPERDVLALVTVYEPGTRP